MNKAAVGKIDDKRGIMNGRNEPQQDRKETGGRGRVKTLWRQLIGELGDVYTCRDTAGVRSPS